MRRNPSPKPGDGDGCKIIPVHQGGMTLTGDIVQHSERLEPSRSAKTVVHIRTSQ